MELDKDYFVDFHHGYEDCKEDINDYMDKLKNLFNGHLSKTTENKLWKMFRRAFDYVEADKFADADEVFHKMGYLISDEAFAVSKERDRFLRRLDSTLKKHGLGIKTGDDGGINLSFVAYKDHIGFDKETLWGVFLAIERQNKDDQKLLKELRCNNLDTFIAYRELCKDLQGLLPVEQ